MQQRKDPTIRDPVDLRPHLSLIIKEPVWAQAVTHLKLSAREQQIIECLLGGSDSEALIADKLGMAARTVHTHLERVYRKVGATSRSQLLACFFIAYAMHARRN